jgi:hypothetical protein
MPPPVSQCQCIILIDKEWTCTLFRLPMQVPNSWWKGYKKDDKMLNAGTIVGVDFDAPQSNNFHLECINEIYAMQNDAIYIFAGVKHADYNKFTLSPVAPTKSMNKDKVIAPLKK